LSDAPVEVELALDELQSVADTLKESSPNIEICFDLSELRGYHYHTGVVFAAYAPGAGQAIGNGGRYNHVGKSFGRSRPATGFNMCLKTLVQLNRNENPITTGIFVPATNETDQHRAIEKLRLAGNRVVMGFHGQEVNSNELGCDRQLILVGNEFQVVPI
jgi:ATP phosphoribosyltransferase regulatory subunit